MRLLKAGIIAILSACVALGAASAAFAYPADLTDPRTCADCHGREADESTETVAPTRKGPHGGYTSGTRKCATCHSVHDAPAGGVLLLPAATVKATCETCHDGTGGAGVYGVVKARTDMEQPAASHRVEATSTIPGGDGDTGGSAIGTFSGQGGTLTCSDCHSPHDSNTVEPFTGDRLRASVTSDTVYAAEKTNRLLKQMPSSAETSVSVYGAGWCATCHKGRVGQHREDSGLMQSHPVMDSDEEYFYDNVQVVAGFDTTETAIGRLGQDNRGYVMPIVDDPEVDPRPAPLCQQCHEDARDVGPRERGGEPMLSEDQEFRAGSYFRPGVEESEEPTGNPRFQVFPHESDVEYFLVRPVTKPDEQSLSYQLCLNCHSLRHDVPEEYQWCLECHTTGDAADIHETAEYGCLTCHEVAPSGAAAEEPEMMVLAAAEEYTPQLTLDCGTAGCHDEDPHGEHVSTQGLGSGTVLIFELGAHEPGVMLEDGEVAVECGICHTTDISAAHAGRCQTCHPAPRDSFETWEGGCQQGSCHTSYHDNTSAAHSSTDDPNAAPYYGDCDNCHNNPTWEVQQAACLNCHTAYSPGDTTPPVTTSDARSTYVGPALIRFSKTDGGKIGIGTTFHRLNGGPTRVGSSLRVDEPGQYELEFWSVDQSGNIETPSKSVGFAVVPDTEPPVTVTSDVTAGATYYATRTIRFTVTDNSFLGAEATYYQLWRAGEIVQSGTGIQLTVPSPTSGSVDYILHYWSVDHSGNAEMPNMVSFTMAGGTGTIRLVWGDSDLVPLTDPEAEASWVIRRGGSSGPIVATGSGAMPGWSGVDDVIVPVNATPYWVSVDWWDSDYGYMDNTIFSNVLIDTAGTVVRLSY